MTVTHTRQLLEGAVRKQLQTSTALQWSERQAAVDRGDTTPRRLLVEKAGVQHLRRQHAAAVARAKRLQVSDNSSCSNNPWLETRQFC
jgi:hypothetical protein